MIKVGIGQDSHRFDFENPEKKLILGGVEFEGEPPLAGNSDADAVLHAVTNAVSGVTGVNIIGKISDEMCSGGVTDSREYLRLALEYLGSYEIIHVSISIECQQPKISPKIDELKKSIASALGLSPNDVGITATSGEGLTSFGRGEGIQAISIVTCSLVQT